MYNENDLTPQEIGDHILLLKKIGGQILKSAALPAHVKIPLLYGLWETDRWLFKQNNTKLILVEFLFILQEMKWGALVLLSPGYIGESLPQRVLHFKPACHHVSWLSLKWAPEFHRSKHSKFIILYKPEPSWWLRAKFWQSLSPLGHPALSPFIFLWRSCTFSLPSGHAFLLWLHCFTAFTAF